MSLGRFKFDFCRRCSILPRWVRFLGSLIPGGLFALTVLPQVQGATGDATAPAAITNLVAGAPAIAPQLHVTLTWTAPGDDGTTGTASSYDIRYRSDGPITDSSWATAKKASYGLTASGILVASPPAPKSAGAVETFTVVGLKPNTTYYWAIRTSDESSNVSGVSNSATGATLKYEGYGYQSVGGGELTIRAVTNLSASGTGSLRQAILDSSAGGYIVFTATGSGTIALPTPGSLDLPSNLTIDGSTAVSPGATITWATSDHNDGLLVYGKHDVIMTYLRVQGFWSSGSEIGPDDCITLDSSTCNSGDQVDRFVADHLTVRNCGDAGLDPYHCAQDISFINNLMMNNFHPGLDAGSSGTGPHFGDPSGRHTFYRDLYANGNQRNPLIGYYHTDMEFVNNIIYHWTDYGFGLQNAFGYEEADTTVKNDINIVKNYFIAGSGRADQALAYGQASGCDLSETTSCPYSDGQSCHKQGATHNVYNNSHSIMGQVFVDSNVFPSSNCDEYSTVASRRPINPSFPGAALSTEVSAAALWTILPGIGTRVRLSDEQSLIDSVASALGATGSVCGNNVKESGETCDGLDLAGATCISKGYAGGSLRCSTNCASFDTSGCVTNARPADVQNLRRTDVVP